MRLERWDLSFRILEWDFCNWPICTCSYFYSLKKKNAVSSSPGLRSSLLSFAEAQLTSAHISSSLARQSRFSVSEHIWVSGEGGGSISSMELKAEKTPRGTGDWEPVTPRQGWGQENPPGDLSDGLCSCWGAQLRGIFLH